MNKAENIFYEEFDTFVIYILDNDAENRYDAYFRTIGSGWMHHVMSVKKDSHDMAWVRAEVLSRKGCCSEL